MVTKSYDKLSDIINNPYKDEEIYDGYCDFLDSIEKFKIDISSIEKDESKRINCNLFKKFINDDIENSIKNYNNICPKGWEIKSNNNFKIFFPYKIMIDLTKEIIVDKVIYQILNQLYMPEVFPLMILSFQ